MTIRLCLWWEAWHQAYDLRCQGGRRPLLDLSGFVVFVVRRMATRLILLANDANAVDPCIALNRRLTEISALYPVVLDTMLMSPTWGKLDLGGQPGACGIWLTSSHLHDSTIAWRKGDSDTLPFSSVMPVS